ncbi:MAG TPA: hypothetical protein VN605_14165 [Thermoanaerobaculia bacterium]|nr:hypothetical protein [Thermoanaerobaculia bacterium]
MKRAALALLLAAAPAFAQSVANTSRGVVVAHDGIVELPGHWRAEGVATPARIVTSSDRIALLDPIANEVRTIELASGRSQLARTGETPIDGLFVDRDLYVVTRDSRALERIRDGAKLALPADPAFVREANGRLYVYSRLEGIVSEIAFAPFAIRRSVRVAPFAAAFDVDGRNGYLVVPHEGKIRTFSLTTMQPTGAIDVGAVPVDVARLSSGSALSARTLAIADPSAKKVWLIEGVQSTSQAVARGFIRGLLGLGLYSNRTSQFPTGVDRVFVHGSRWLAYDSASGTLYRFTKSSSAIVAKDVTPSSFAATADGVALWRNGRIELLR